MIKCVGRYADGAYAIDMDPIYEALKAETKRKTKYHREDLDIDIAMMSEWFKGEKQKGERVYYVGIRESGVDHENFIRCRLAAPGCYGRKPYAKIYKVTGTFKGDGVTVTMEDKTRSIQK